ncbi:MAG: hypothetical protein QM516_07595 [Limnohabitans sp.]|nr:hypothetical protein [Limnohabitans sp.]
MSSIAFKSGTSLVARSQVLFGGAFGSMLVATALLAGAPTVFAQAGGQAAVATDGVRKNIDDFIHYVLVGKADMAQAAGEAVLGASATDEQLAAIVDDADLADRLMKAVSRSRAMGGVSDLATKIEDRVEDGRRALSRDPQRITDAIGMLSKTLREQRIAEERLNAAGEFAVPQLLAVIVEGTDAKAEVAATRNLVALKRFAVMPLAMSLDRLPPEAQRKVVGMLADIGWPTALPFICEVAAREGTPTDVRAACEVAIERLGGKTSDVSAQFTALARKFFNREDSLVPYPAEATNNTWSFDEGGAGFGGLTAKPVGTPIFCDEMAMALARRALAVDQANNEALAIYIASDLRRENTLGSDAQPGRYSPQFFATAAGPSICSMVLAMGIDTRDTSLVRDAIAVLSQTGSGAVLTASGGRNPMIEALRYSDRRVRLDAALALAKCAPTGSFPSDFMVVPTLASAIGDGGISRAAVLGGSLEDRQAIGQQLSSVGFQPLAGADSFDALEVEVVKANGVELVVVRGTAETVKSGVERVRASGSTASSPILAIANALEEAAVRRAFEGDATVVVWTEGSTSDSFRTAAEQAIRATAGSVMDTAEADEYAIRATEALRSIASGGSTPFQMGDAEAVLLKALKTKQGGLRASVAEVLSIMATPAALQALVDVAIAASADEQVVYCDFAAAAARKSGGKGDDSQLSTLRGVIAASQGEVADAAGRLYGSLDAGSAEAVKLIVGE